MESRLETTSRAVNSPVLQQGSVCPVLFLQSTTSEKRIEILYEPGDFLQYVRNQAKIHTNLMFLMPL